MAPKKIKLISSDRDDFLVPRCVALQSETIRMMLEDGVNADEGIPLLNVSSATLARVLEYCTAHADAAMDAEEAAMDVSDKAEAVVDSTGAGTGTGRASRSEEELALWDAAFAQVDHASLFDLLLVG